jgi:hypothetical protein
MRRFNSQRIAIGIICVSAPLLGAGLALAATTTYTVSPVTDISASCSGQNAEVEQAADATRGYVYETWMGCNGIAFARSTDGGLTFQTPISVTGSVGSNTNSWDPAAGLPHHGHHDLRHGSRLQLLHILDRRRDDLVDPDSPRPR